MYVSYLKLPRAGPITGLVVLMLGYIAVFGTLTYQQQSNFGTFGFDMGIYDQGIWLVSHFKSPFDTIRGLNYFGHHVNIITLLFRRPTGSGPVPTFSMRSRPPGWPPAPFPYGSWGATGSRALGWLSGSLLPICCTRRWNGSTGGTSTPMR